MNQYRHREERRDVAIQEVRGHGSPRYARDDEAQGLVYGKRSAAIAMTD